VASASYEWHEEHNGGPALPMQTVEGMTADEVAGWPYWVSGDDTARNVAGRVYWE